MLIALEKTINHKYVKGKPVSPMWICRCDCGKEKEVSATDLQGGKVTSCGCLISRGEYSVSCYLDSKNISYKRQYSFDDLRGERNGLLRFDFGVLDGNGNLLFLIEYQGSQHYNGTSEFGKQARESTDEQKKEYCRNNGIHLYEIRYDEDVNDAMSKILILENL